MAGEVRLAYCRMMGSVSRCLPSSVAPYEPGSDRVEDLTLDQNGILKEIRLAGNGSARPGYGDRVQLKYLAYFPDGTVFDVCRDRFEFTLGKGDVIRALDIAVATMTRGEVAIIYCRPEYAYGELGNPPRIAPDATLVFEIELCDWNGEDLSKNGDGGIRRRQLTKGVGYSSPNEGATIDIHLIGRYNGRVFDDRDVTFVLGKSANPCVPEGVTRALERFLKGETSVLTLAPKYAFGNEGSVEFNVPPNVTVEYEVTLDRFEKGKEIWEMDTVDKLEQSSIFKNKGTDSFRAGKYSLAMEHYQRIVDYMDYEANVSDADLQKHCQEMKLAALLNVALCHLKLGEFIEAKDACEKALTIDPKSEKALFRRAQAHLATSDFELSLQDFNSVLLIDPTNKAASNQIALCNDKVKEARQKEKQTYGNMFAKFAERDEVRERERNRLQADVLVNPGTWDERNNFRLSQQQLNEGNPLINVQMLGAKNGTFW